MDQASVISAGDAVEAMSQDSDRNTELENQIVQRIMECTWGRIRLLQVEVTKHNVLVEGFASTYYVKQLAIKALMDVIAALSAPPANIEMEISLCAPAERGQGRPHLI